MEKKKTEKKTTTKSTSKKSVPVSNNKKSTNTKVITNKQSTTTKNVAVKKDVKNTNTNKLVKSVAPTTNKVTSTTPIKATPSTNKVTTSTTTTATSTAAITGVITRNKSVETYSEQLKKAIQKYYFEHKKKKKKKNYHDPEYTDFIETELDEDGELVEKELSKEAKKEKRNHFLKRFGKKRGKKFVKKQIKKFFKRWWGSLQGVSQVAVFTVAGVGITAAVAVPVTLANTIWKADQYNVVMNLKDEEEAYQNIITANKPEVDKETGNTIVTFAINHDGVEFTGIDSVKKGSHTLISEQFATEKNPKEYTFDATEKKLTIDKNAMSKNKGDLVIKPIYEKLAIAKITLPDDKNEVYVRESITINATVEAKDGKTPFDPTITWETDNKTAVKLTPNGLSCTIVGSKETNQTVTITAKAGNVISNPISISVKMHPVTGLAILGIDDNMVSVNNSLQLSVKVQPDNATYKDVTWKVESSSPKGCAIIDQFGLLKGVEVGTATISATSKFTGGEPITVTKDISVQIVRVQSIKINSSSFNVSKGGNLTLNASISPSNASNKRVKWDSSNTDVAIIDKDTGKLTGKSKGTTVVSATSTDGSSIIATETIVVYDLELLDTIDGINYYDVSKPGGGKECIISAATGSENDITEITINDDYIPIKSKEYTVVGVSDLGFKNCPNLSRVTIDTEKISYIGQGAFENCNALSEIHFNTYCSFVATSEDGEPFYWGASMADDFESPEQLWWAAYENSLSFKELLSNRTLTKCDNFKFKRHHESNCSEMELTGNIDGLDIVIPNFIYYGRTAVPTTYFNAASEPPTGTLKSIVIPYTTTIVATENIDIIKKATDSIKFKFPWNWISGDSTPVNNLDSEDINVIKTALSSVTNGMTSPNSYEGVSFDEVPNGYAAYKDPDHQLNSNVIALREDSTIQIGNGDHLGFPNCSNVIAIYFSKGLCRVYADAFSGCTNLEHVFVNQTVAEWELLISDTNMMPATWRDTTKIKTIHCLDGDYTYNS